MTMLCALLELYATFVLYLAIMNLRRAKRLGTLSRTAYILGYPLLWIGLVFDFVGNLILTFPMLDLPREFTITARLERYAKGG